MQLPTLIFLLAGGHSQGLFVEEIFELGVPAVQTPTAAPIPVTATLSSAEIPVPATTPLSEPVASENSPAPSAPPPDLVTLSANAGGSNLAGTIESTPQGPRENLIFNRFRPELITENVIEEYDCDELSDLFQKAVNVKNSIDSLPATEYNKQLDHDRQDWAIKNIRSKLEVKNCYCDGTPCKIKGMVTLPDKRIFPTYFTVSHYDGSITCGQYCTGPGNGRSQDDELPINWNGATCYGSEIGCSKLNKPYCACKSTGLGWPGQAQVRVYHDGQTSCEYYCRGDRGRPLTNELPRAWNGSTCAGTNATQGCDGIEMGPVYCDCRQTGWGWYAFT